MIKSVLSNWLGLVVIGAVAFLLTPFLIHRLGDLEFGMWVLSSSLAGYSGLLELGIRPTVQRFVGRLVELRDRRALDQTLSTALMLTLAIGLMILIATVALAPLLPSFFGLHGGRRTEFESLVVLLGFNAAVGLPTLLLGTYLCGYHRFDLYNLLQIVRELSRAALIVVVLLEGHRAVAVAVVSVAVTLASLPLTLALVRKVDPGLSLAWRQARRARARQILGFSFWMFLNNAGQLLRDYTDSLVIGRLLSVALITPFNVAIRLMQYYRPVIEGATSPLLPQMSGLDGLGREAELKQLFLQATKLTLLITLLIGSILILNGRDLLRLWVGEKYISSYGLLVVLTLGQILTLGQQPSNILLVAKGKHRPYGLWTMGEGLLNLILSIYWARRYGLMGVALGTLVPLALVKLTLQPWYTLRVAGVSWRTYVSKALARPLLTCGLFLASTHWITRVFPARSVAGFAGTVVWQTALFIGLACAIGLEGSERDAWWQRLRQLNSGLRLASAAAAAGSLSPPSDRRVL